jgi:hypothetical protein
MYSNICDPSRYIHLFNPVSDEYPSVQAAVDRDVQVATLGDVQVAVQRDVQVDADPDSSDDEPPVDQFAYTDLAGWLTDHFTVLENDNRVQATLNRCRWAEGGCNSAWGGITL